MDLPKDQGSIYRENKARATAREASRNPECEAGSATVGQLAKVYMESQNLRTDIRQSTKDHRKFIVISLLQSLPELAEKLPSKVTEYEIADPRCPAPV